MSYAHHITDPSEVLPCNRNNCRCGDSENCMYYNSPGKAHYNYVAVQGTGDAQSPYYSCPSLAYDTFNQEQLYGDHAIGGLGGYNDTHPYGQVNDPKGWYGPMDASYPAKPTCSGYTNTNAVPDDGNQDYDWWDPYHKYHANHKMSNAVFGGNGGNGGNGGYLPMDTGVNTLLMLAVLGALYYNRNKLGTANMTTMAVVALILFFFFNRS